MAKVCALCGVSPKKSWRARQGLMILKCEACGIAYLADFKENPLRYYEGGIEYYQAWWQNKAKEEPSVRRAKEKTADWVLNEMAPFLRPGARILENGCAFGYFLESARKRGYEVFGAEISRAAEEARQSGLRVWEASLDQLDLPRESLDAVVMLDVIEHLAEPEITLRKAKDFLSPRKGILSLITPDVESLPCRLFGRRWAHFKEEHLYYYSRRGLAKLFEKHGFEIVSMKTAYKGTSLQYLASHSRRYHNLPDFLNTLLRKLPFSSLPVLVPSELFCIARVKK